LNRFSLRLEKVDRQRPAADAIPQNRQAAALRALGLQRAFVFDDDPLECCKLDCLLINPLL
jgi:hypothetical protein